MNAKQRIAAAAQLEFGEHGFQGARVARIARRAGVNKQLLFYYFGSKAGLYQQVCRAVLAEAASSADRASAGPPGLPPPERLRQAVRHLHDSLGANPALVAALVDPGAPDAGAAADARSATANLLRGLSTAVSDGQGLGYFRDDVDPVLTANQALALCAGHVALRLPTPTVRWQESVAELLLQAIVW